jgi:prepilin-type N-terminal cleavage/methylation domain-containing protein
MKTKLKSQGQAFSFIEVLVVLVVVAVLVAILLPAFLAPRHNHSPRIQCISNLKQIGIGFRLYARDNDGQYPGFNETNQAWNYFQAMGTELTSPRVLMCPADPRAERKDRALDFEESGDARSFPHPTQRNAALSYFYGADAAETVPAALLAGDRNLSISRRIVTGMLLVGTNASLRWTADIHKDAGNIALADGSAHQVSNERLQEIFRLLPQASQRLILP